MGNYDCFSRIYMAGSIDTIPVPTHTEVIVQLSFKKRQRTARSPVSLAELKNGEHGIIDRIDLPHDVAQRLMELGFLPGTVVTRALSAPGGDPRVFRVDGSEVALRRETAAKLLLRLNTHQNGVNPKFQNEAKSSKVK